MRAAARRPVRCETTGSTRGRLSPALPIRRRAPESHAAIALLVRHCRSIAVSNSQLAQPPTQLPDLARRLAASPAARASARRAPDALRANRPPALRRPNPGTPPATRCAAHTAPARRESRRRSRSGERSESEGSALRSQRHVDNPCRGKASVIRKPPFVRRGEPPLYRVTPLAQTPIFGGSLAVCNANRVSATSSNEAESRVRGGPSLLQSQPTAFNLIVATTIMLAKSSNPSSSADQRRRQIVNSPLVETSNPWPSIAAENTSDALPNDESSCSSIAIASTRDNHD